MQVGRGIQPPSTPQPNPPYTNTHLVTKVTIIAITIYGKQYSVPWIRMSGGRIKLDLDSILQGYGFLTMLLSGDLLNFGNKGNNQEPSSILASISVLG